MAIGKREEDCPRCGGVLGSIIDLATGQRGVRCLKSNCLFNFADQLCSKCGGSVMDARRQDMHSYLVTCGHQHVWTC